MARFDSAIALAKKLIKKNGQAVTLRGFTAGAAPDPAKPWKPGGNVAADQTIEAVFLDYEQRYIDGQTIRMGDQRVFLGWAQNYRSKAREAALRRQVLTDVHSPGEYRADTVRNLDAWYSAFDVQPDQKLYLPPEGRVRIW